MLRWPPSVVIADNNEVCQSEDERSGHVQRKVVISLQERRDHVMLGKQFCRANIQQAREVVHPDSLEEVDGKR